MKYIIDRLEEGIAVCENELKKLISIPKDLLPDGLKEGDVLEEQEGALPARRTRDRGAQEGDAQETDGFV